MKALRALAVSLGVTAAAAVAVANAPPATADMSSYLQDIYSSSYAFYGPPSDYMALGDGVCALTSTGTYTQDMLTAWVFRNSGPGIYIPQAQFIVVAAEVFLC